MIIMHHCQRRHNNRNYKHNNNTSNVVLLVVIMIHNIVFSLFSLLLLLLSCSFVVVVVLSLVEVNSFQFHKVVSLLYPRIVIPSQHIHQQSLLLYMNKNSKKTYNHINNNNDYYYYNNNNSTTMKYCYSTTSVQNTTTTTTTKSIISRSKFISFLSTTTLMTTVSTTGNLTTPISSVSATTPSAVTTSTSSSSMTLEQTVTNKQQQQQMSSVSSLPSSSFQTNTTTATSTMSHHIKNTNRNKNSQNDETISGLFAGAALTITKTIVKYPMDTATIRLQMINTTYSIYNITELFSNSYIGIIVPLLFNIPAGAIFFAVKDTISSILKSISQIPISSIVIDSSSSNDLSSLLLLVIGLLFVQPMNFIIDNCNHNRTFRTCIAVFIAQIPYWLVRNPSEVIKTNEQAIGTTTINNVNNNNNDNIDQQQQYNIQNNNITSLLDQMKYYYTGYWENVIYAYPADVFKFVCYEQLSSILISSSTSSSDMNQLYDAASNNNLQYAIQSAWCGAIATALAQYITTPLDVIRNRVMVNTDGTNSLSYPSIVTSSIENSMVTTILSSNDTNDHSNNETMIDVAGERQSSSTSLLSFVTLYAQSLVQLGRNEGYDGLFAGAIPRLMKAFISGAIQFATYEETKQALLNFLSKNP